MAASSSPDPRGTSPAERFRLLRELGARVVPAWAALDAAPDGRTQLVVVERVTRGGVYGDQEVADWVRDARRLATLEHPNVARVRDVFIGGEDVLVVSDFADGVRWSELATSAQKPSLEMALRVLVDVLSGLSAVHNLRDAKREPLKLVHGELTPECVVLGLDGVARIVSTCRPRSATARPGRSGSAYLAPEVLLADESADARADVYGVGVMLWEALSGKPLFPNTTQPSAIVTQLLSGRVARASVPDGLPWAAPLADVAARALSADPHKRFASAAALAAELRRIAGPKLAPPVRVAAYVRGTFGDRIRERREQLERGEAVPREVSGVEAPPASEDVEVVFDGRSSTAPTPVPPAHNASTKPPPPLEPVVAKPPPLPGPPPLPAFRPRQPTLTGVAPPAELSVEGAVSATPVVVPSSSHPPPPAIAPPTPMVAFVVPPAALVPRDLPGPTGATPALVTGRAAVPAAPAVAPSPPPSPLPIVELEEAPLRRRRPRAVLLAMLAGPVAFVVAVVVWWLASRSPATASDPPAVQTPVTTATEATSPPSTAPPPITTAAASQPTPQSPEAVAPSEPAHVTAPLPGSTGAPAPAPRPAPTPTYAAPPPTWVAPAPTRPSDKRKYEPEGI